MKLNDEQHAAMKQRWKSGQFPTDYGLDAMALSDTVDDLRLQVQAAQVEMRAKCAESVHEVWRVVKDTDETFRAGVSTAVDFLEKAILAQPLATDALAEHDRKLLEPLYKIVNKWKNSPSATHQCVKGVDERTNYFHQQIAQRIKWMAEELQSQLAALDAKEKS